MLPAGCVGCCARFQGLERAQCRPPRCSRVPRNGPSNSVTTGPEPAFVFRCKIGMTAPLPPSAPRYIFCNAAKKVAARALRSEIWCRNDGTAGHLSRSLHLRQWRLCENGCFCQCQKQMAFGRSSIQPWENPKTPGPFHATARALSDLWS